MYKSLFPCIGTKFPRIGIKTVVRQSVSFPTVWRDDVPEELAPDESVLEEVIYLVDKDGNLLLDKSGMNLTVR